MARPSRVWYLALGAGAARALRRLLVRVPRRLANARAFRSATVVLAPRGFRPSVLRDLPKGAVVVGVRRLGSARAFLRAGAVDVLPAKLDRFALALARERARRAPDLLEPIGRFASAAAHELASPLDGSLRFLRLAERFEEDRSEARRYVREAREGLERAVRIVGDLLALARDETSETASCDLRDLLAAVLDSASTPLGRVRLEVSPGFAEVPRELGLALSNLIRNALQASPAGRPVVVAASRDRAGRLRISVEDEGPGLPPSARRVVDEPFRRRRVGDRKAGLGLSIAAVAARRAGGRIRFLSKRGKGTTATVVLPARDAR